MTIIFMATRNKYLVLDSSALIALANNNDSTHKKAVDILQNIANEKYFGLLPNDIYIETINAIGKKLNKTLAAKAAFMIRGFKWLDVIESNESSREDSLEKFRQTGPQISLTDCIVMATADEYKTKQIFGFDKHFKTAGYKRIGIDK